MLLLLKNDKLPRRRSPDVATCENIMLAMEEKMVGEQIKLPGHKLYIIFTQWSR